ncbi:MAG TPA: sigma-70 family RNA polymerase sigma factor [Acidobacteriota bacterium]|nr:sigma-70 family RNA polymerase sigma factor [Acidobacteriota bacterium]
METAKAIDHAIMRRIQKDEFPAFEELVDRYKSRLVNLIYRMLSDQNEAEDLVQETFLRVWTHRQDYDFSYCLSTWVYTIALNLAKNELRKRRRFKFFSISEMTEKGLELPDPKMGPSALGHLLEGAISCLPTKYKAAFLLRDVEQLPYEDVAQILGVPLGTVKSRVNRARSVLKNELKPKLEQTRALSESSLVPVRSM